MTGVDERDFMVGRARVTVKVDVPATAGALALVEWDIPEGAPGPPVHIHHQATETFYVLDGEVNFVYDDRRIDAAPGEALHIPAGIQHTMRNIGNGPARVLELYAPGKLLALIEEVGALVAAGITPTSDEMHAAYQRHQSEIVEALNQR
jgi:mannose-6-phosphate isomerase-like protein (cupin superfamily)